MIHDLVVTDDPSVKTIYYVSDIHLEHQLHLQRKSTPEIRALIDEKITELLSDVQLKYTDILLICGDTANSVELEAIFYKSLRRQWRGAIISVLGNHELWDGHCAGVEKSRPIDDIIADYRQITEGLLLENELRITYRRQKSVVIDEKTLLEAKNTELSELCDESSFIILGGIGFSGLNPKYNASLGLYRSTVSIDEDIERSDRFRTVYEKVLACAPEQNVIVLTHTQMKDWSNSGYNHNWTYISGHTHQNSLIRSEDGTTVLSDNQIGYEVQP